MTLGMVDLVYHSVLDLEWVMAGDTHHMAGAILITVVVIGRVIIMDTIMAIGMVIMLVVDIILEEVTILIMVMVTHIMGILIMVIEVEAEILMGVFVVHEEIKQFQETVLFQEVQLVLLQYQVLPLVLQHVL